MYLSLLKAKNSASTPRNSSMMGAVSESSVSMTCKVIEIEMLLVLCYDRYDRYVTALNTVLQFTCLDNTDNYLTLMRSDTHDEHGKHPSS